MAYFHFLIDVSTSTSHFRHTNIFWHLNAQIDLLEEANQTAIVPHDVGITLFADKTLYQAIKLPIDDLRKIVSEFREILKPGSAVIDQIARTLSLVSEHAHELQRQKKMLIFSDFEDNLSHFYSLHVLGEMILSQQLSNDFELHVIGPKNSFRKLLLNLHFIPENILFLDIK